MNYQVLLLFIAYMAFIVSLAYFRPRGERSKYLIRKSVHLITGLVIFFLTYHVSRQALLLLFISGTLFSFATFFIRRLNYIHVTGVSSWGTLFYPLGILSSFLVLQNLPMHYFQMSVLFLAVSDTVASIGGYLVRGNPRFTLLNEKKTLLGILGFALTAFFISFVIFTGSGGEKILYLILAVICAVHFEIISYKGSDNLTIPLGMALFFYLTHGRPMDVGWIVALVLAMAVFSILLFRMGILSRKGAIAAHLLGIYLFGILGPDWGIPVVFFFLSSVIFTRINGMVNRKSFGTGSRNVFQVMANISAGLVFSVIYLLAPQTIYTYLFISAVAAVTADTWASEIGPVFHKRCFSLSEGRMSASGVSGGISVAGTLAAFAGSLLVTSLACWVFFQEMDFQIIFLLALAGFLASLVDSVLGAFLEPRLEASKLFGKRPGSERVSANDLINLLASLTAPLFFLLLHRYQP